MYNVRNFIIVEGNVESTEKIVMLQKDKENKKII